MRVADTRLCQLELTFLVEQHLSWFVLWHATGICALIRTFLEKCPLISLKHLYWKRSNTSLMLTSVADLCLGLPLRNPLPFKNIFLILIECTVAAFVCLSFICCTNNFLNVIFLLIRCNTTSFLRVFPPSAHILSVLLSRLLSCLSVTSVDIMGSDFKLE